MVSTRELPENSSPQEVREYFFRRLREGIPAKEMHSLLPRVQQAMEQESGVDPRLLDALHAFQHGSPEESNQGFAELRELEAERQLEERRRNGWCVGCGSADYTQVCDRGTPEDGFKGLYCGPCFEAANET